MEQTEHARGADRLAVIVFTDLVNSTALMSRLGDESMHELASVHLAEVRRAVSAYGGTVHKALGDGIMASFASAVGALAAAATVARDVEALDRREGGVGFAVRVGVSVGEPIAEGGDLQGLAVVIAARLCAAAAAGDVLVQDAVRGLVEPRREFDFAAPTALELKGIADPVSASVLDWRSHVPNPARPAAAGGEEPRAAAAVPEATMSLVRASDRDRERAAERVRHAAGTGQLTYAELEDRLALVFVAQSLTDLDRVADDLGTAPVPLRTPTDRSLEVRRTVSLFGGSSRRGVWDVAERSRVVSIMGSSDVDLTDARLGYPVTTLRVLALWGGVTIRVPEGVEVRLSRLAIAGGTSVRLGSDPVPAGAPILHLRLISLMAGIKVRRRRPPREMGRARPPAR